ncbi:MAG: ATP-binding protein [Candidatus Gracilibacteria bacterium]|nr:ATP-binding protein [Candidatus Gracilibacteria bacterium]MDD2909283.1 ATP-binding protein [Candidatus Gracilibacteria bacterium]
MIQEILKENIVERDFYMNNIKKYLDTPLIKVLIGQRRVGKSTILKSIIKYLYQTKDIIENNFFYINKESPYFDHIRNYDDLKKEFEEFKKNTKPGKIFIGIDEIQDIEGWEKFINGYSAIYGEQAEIFITGSNSFLLSGELATYLTGRYIEFPIYSLSFEEFCIFKKESRTKDNFIEYLKYGGLPAIFKMEYTADTIFSYLLGVYNTIVLKDIIQYHSIKNVVFFKDLYKYTLANIGNIVSGKSIKDYLKSQNIHIGNDTVLNFLGYAQDTFLLNKVYSVNPETKKYFEIYNKYYVSDLGLRNALVGYDFGKDIGKLLENYVFLELKRNRYEVKIGKLKSNTEIDFIATKSGITKYFQVCYLLGSEETIKREYNSLKEISDNWEKYVISFDDINHGIDGGIKHINIMDIGKVL